MDPRNKKAETKVSATLPTKRGYCSHVIRPSRASSISPALRNDDQLTTCPWSNTHPTNNTTATVCIRLRVFETAMRQELWDAKQGGRREKARSRGANGGVRRNDGGGKNDWFRWSQADGREGGEERRMKQARGQRGGCIPGVCMYVEEEEELKSKSSSRSVASSQRARTLGGRRHNPGIILYIFMYTWQTPNIQNACMTYNLTIQGYTNQKPLHRTNP